MKTKRLFSHLIQMGTRLIILASMLMTAMISTVAPAFAATTAEIVPTGNGFYTSWTNDYTNVNEGTAAASCTSGDSLSTGTGNARESVVISLAGIPDGSTITSIDVLVRDRRDNNGGGTYATFVRFNGVDSSNSATHATSGSGTACTGSYTDTFDVVDTVKGSGTTLQIGVIKLNSGGITNRIVRVGVLSAVVTYTAPKQDQTISFTSAAPAGAMIGGAAYTPAAAATSGLPVTFSIDASAASVCSLTAGAVSFQGGGTCVINANQAGDAYYNAAPQVQQSFGVASSSSGGSTFDLYAVTGTTSLPGLANPVPVWGYSLNGSNVTKPGGPVLEVNQGDVVTITLHNTLSEPTALLFQGQNIATDLTGAAASETKIYAFTAGKPGTFLYEAGLLPNAQHQVAMGLYGALIVRPSGAPSQAYSDASTAFDVEQVLVLSELDTSLNNSAAPAAFDLRQYSPKYYLINGEAYPDTDPIAAAAGDTVLLRYVNAGLQAHSMSTLGLAQHIIAQDGNAYSIGHSVVAETISTGQTLDTLVSVPATGTKFPVYDASLFLRNNTGSGTFGGLGGMLTMLTVGTPGSVDTAGPIASGLNLAPNPWTGSGDVTLTAALSDASTGNSNVTAAEFYVDTTSGSPSAMTGALASPTELVSGTIPASLLGVLAAGNHTIYVRGQDAAGNWGSFVTITLAVQLVAPPAATIHFSTLGPNGFGGDSADIVYWDGSTFSQPIDIPSGTNVDGLDRIDDTHYYVSFTGDVTLPGVGTVQKEDVLYFDAGSWSVYFDGTGNGLGAANIDAISVNGSLLYFSLSDTTLPGGVGGVGDDADIYSWNGFAFARLLDATALGWSGNNVDGFVFVEAAHFYLSYSPTSTSVAGLGTVQDEDVLYYNNGIWTVLFDGTSHGLTSTSLDIDAFDNP